MTSLRKLQNDWENLAQIDPLGSICTDPRKDGRKWVPEEFFQTGEREIQTVLNHVQSLGLSPDRKSPALDFGCGVGRLTAPLSRYFAECWGVDIAPTMIELAKEFHKNNCRCKFLLNQADHLPSFSDGNFGFIYSSIALQHMKETYVRSYLGELVRVLKPGGVLVFQVADRNSLTRRIRNLVGVRRRMKRLLGRRVPPALLMEMHCIAENKIRELLSTQNVQIVDVRLTNSTAPDFNGNLQFLHEPPEHGLVSKQYCVVKNHKDGHAGWL
ncbi:MAG TPA: class I SAM-dependent methyltransferase [Candidatus Angelobacter sp.]